MNTKRDVRLAGVVQGQEEIDAVMRVLKTEPPWHVSGQECLALQKELAEFYDVKYCLVVNSGSSANLLALQALRLHRGAKDLTSACGFPATLNPLIHLRMRPVLVDYDLQTLNANLLQVELALQSHKIEAIMLAHTMGSALDMDKLMDLVYRYRVRLIEDCCESLGTRYGDRLVGSFGDVSTVSFYSSHQMSGFGGGGAVLTNSREIYEEAKSLRDWGKKSVREGYICTKMDTMVGDLPYDQQYTYDTVGYNMRYPDANCAYAREQLKRLVGFVHKRQVNYLYLHKELQGLPLHFMEWSWYASPAFFGFPIVLKQEGLRDKLVEHLESNGVHVRLFFAGNILKHEPYVDLDYDMWCDNKPGFQCADYLMRNALFCGCWPGLNEEDMKYTADVIKEFFNERS
jgi:CDP-6-deoxy-D-xylo-4-hexulose-3-dehydrase